MTSVLYPDLPEKGLIVLIGAFRCGQVDAGPHLAGLRNLPLSAR
ncbi:hypothetical protein [Streptomyces collinus]